MSNYNIPITECTGSIYKYPLEGTSDWMVICVIDIPYSKKELQSKGVTTISFTGVGMWSSGYGFSAASVGLDGYDLPVWSYATGKGLANTFLKAYSDDNFIMQIDDTSRMVISILQNKTVLGTKRPGLALVPSLSSGEIAATITITIFRFTDGEYLDSNANSALNYISVFGYELTSSTSTITEFPSLDKKGKKIIDTESPVNTSLSTLNLNTDSKIKLFYDTILKKSRVYDARDPNGGGGDSKPNGGGGSDDIGGDSNPDDGLPTISALDSGLLTAYNPTIAELQSLGRFLWSDSFDVNSFKKLFNDPFDTLLGLSIIPIKPSTSTSKNIMFGNMDSGVSAPVVSNQWVSKDMGSVALNEVWKGALDYSPSTSASIYLPYIGMRQLNINDVMGATIHLIYKFDVLTGTCIAQLYVNHNHMGNKDSGFSWNSNQGLLYEFMGQCAVNIPLASQDFTNTIRSAVSAVGMVAGASASIATGNPVLGVATMTMASANLGMQANTPTVERSGHLSGGGALLGYYQPFLVVTRPHQCKPKRYYALRGVPSQVYTDKLSSCTGFTQITANNNIHVSGAEDSELAEIQNLLVSGVYFPDKKR